MECSEVLRLSPSAGSSTTLSVLEIGAGMDLCNHSLLCYVVWEQRSRHEGPHAHACVSSVALSKSKVGGAVFLVDEVCGAIMLEVAALADGQSSC